jgi:hypothetical protein
MSAVMKRRLAMWLPLATVILAGAGYAAWRYKQPRNGEAQGQ